MKPFFLLLFLSSICPAAIKYVRSTDGVDTDNGTTWALANATLAGGLADAAAGDIVCVSDNHAETQATAMTLTSLGTAASWVKVLCVDDSAEPPTALATSATVSTTGNSSITFAGFAYCYGVIFTAASASSNGSINFNSGSPYGWILDASSLRIGGSNTAARINFGNTSNTGDDQFVELNNTTVSFANAAQGIAVHCPVKWRNTASAVIGTLPTTLFIASTNRPSGWINVDGVDLSALGSGKSLVDLSIALFTKYDFLNCKLGGSVGITTGAAGGIGGAQVRVINCDSGDTNYRYHFQNFYGTITHSADVYRSGGASDGTTSVSRKMVSTADTSYTTPLYSDWVSQWNETTGSGVTVSFATVTDNVTLKDGECWIEVEYPGTSGFPQGGFASDRGGDILTPGTSNQTTDGTSSWTTTGITTPVLQTLSTSVTPQEKGLIRARVCLAKASTTVYFDPEIIATTGKSYMTETGHSNEQPQSSGGGGIFGN